MPDRVEAIQVEGRSRHFICHVPEGLSTDSRPLLIALHGRNLTVEEFRWITHLDALSDRHGFVLVYPEGYGRSWNDGRSNTPAEREGVDDVAFIGTLIDHLTQTVSIDPARIGVTGLSNGGVMCHRLGLELSDRIAAIASVAGLMPIVLEDAIPDHAVSVLLIQGDQDASMPIKGGRAHVCARLRLFLGGVRTRAGPVLSLNDTVARWRTINRCSDETSCDQIAASGSDPTHVERADYTGGRGGTAVESWAIRGGGHTWPGGPRLLGLGRTTSHLDAGEVIWEFIASHAMSAPDRILHSHDGSS